MSTIIQQRKSIVRWGLIVILVLDVILLGVNYKLNEGPRIAPEEVKRLELMEKSYRADNARLSYDLATTGLTPHGSVAFDEWTHGYVAGDTWWSILPRQTGKNDHTSG